ncbi:MAG: LPS export ABC transporter permease LptF [Desulfobacterales bacterium]|nr:LPS export ABC transporter permease LptF [Desulfobacterales bacterium]
MKKTTTLYILKEILPIFFIGLMIFTIILLMDKILKLIELVVNRGGSLSNILMIFLFISPSFLIITIPVAVLLGTLLTFGRLSSDGEITAFKASGISLYQLFFPISIFALATFLLTSFLVFYGLPWGNSGFKDTLYRLAQSKADIEIKERIFNDAFSGLVVYVDRVPLQGNHMEGILIYDQREKGKSNTIIAREGFIINNRESHEIILRLRNGDIHRFEPEAHTFQKIKFEIYDLKLELAKTFAAIEKKLKDKEMSIEDIRKKMEEIKRIGGDTTSYEVEIHKRYAIPFTCIVFALIGVPLGIQPHRSGKSYGFILSILILLAYYISLTASESLAMRKIIPAFSAGWLPNFLFGGLGIYLLVKTARESPFKPIIRLTEALDFIQRKWKGFFENV